MFKGMIDGLVEKSNQLRDETDYVKDDLIYCGKCNTPKQTKVVMFGQTYKPMCLCQCESERIKREKAEDRRRERMQQISSNRSSGFPDREMLNWTFDHDDHSDEHLTSICKRYVSNFGEMKRRGKGLLFYGSVGTGKTFLSACIANALIDEGETCLMTNMSRLTNTMTGLHEGKQEFIDSFRRFSLLVIDDLSSERNTEYMNEIVFNLIDSRYRSGLPLIVTTNLTAEELKRPYELHKQRIYSRLLEMCFPVEVKGRDRRKQKLIADHDELHDLLGL